MLVLHQGTPEVGGVQVCAWLPAQECAICQETRMRMCNNLTHLCHEHNRAGKVTEQRGMQGRRLPELHMATRDASSPLGTVPKGVSEYGWGAAGYQQSGLPTK
jgi:hypothetical protein